MCIKSILRYYYTNTLPVLYIVLSCLLIGNRCLTLSLNWKGVAGTLAICGIHIATCVKQFSYSVVHIKSLLPVPCIKLLCTMVVYKTTEYYKSRTWPIYFVNMYTMSTVHNTTWYWPCALCTYTV